MSFGETRQHREERRARQRERFPELSLLEEGGLGTLFAVDRRRRERGEEPTSLGRAVEATFVRSRPPPPPREPEDDLTRLLAIDLPEVAPTRQLDPQTELETARQGLPQIIRRQFAEGTPTPPPVRPPIPPPPSIPGLDPGENLEPLTIERTIEGSKVRRRSGMTPEVSLELDRRIRHGFALEQDADVSELDFADLVEELAEARTDYEAFTSEPRGPLTFQDEHEKIERLRLLREALSVPGPLTDEQRAGFASTLGIPLRVLADIPGGKQVLEFAIVHGTLRAGGLSNEEAQRRFDEMWDGSPRPLQLLMEEAFDPANALIFMAGVGIAPKLLASSSRPARLLGKTIEPLTQGPLGFAGEVGVGVGARGGFEATEGAPLPVRIATGGAAGLAALPATAATRAGARRGAQLLADPERAIRAAEGPLETSTPGRLGIARRPDELLRTTPEPATRPALAGADDSGRRAELTDGTLDPDKPPATVRTSQPGAQPLQPPEPPLTRGTLLLARGADRLPPDYSVNDVLELATELSDSRVAQANTLLSGRRGAERKLGRVDDQGHMLDVAPSALESHNGLAHPSMYDVAANPGSYSVTPAQRAGLTEFAETIDAVRRERAIFGVDPNLVDIADEGHFLPRAVKETRGIELRRGGGGGTRLSTGGAERGRRFATAAEGEAAGVVYGHPRVAADEYTNRWLKASGDTHVRDLLVPFSETSVMRVSPKLRERFQGFVRQIASLRDSGIRLSDKEDAAIRAFLAADEPDLDALADVIDGIRVTSGRARGANLPQLRELVRSVQQQRRELAPQWRRAREAAAPPPPGRKRVPVELAPALSMRDFSEDVADRIIKHYGRTQRGPVRRALQQFINVPLRFLNATADFSSILRQQVESVTDSPDTFARNLALSFRDVVDSRSYDELLSSERGRQAARIGVAIFGDAAELAEFQAAHWMHRVPVIGQIIRTADNHFIRFNTRMRIDQTLDEIDTIARITGRPVPERQQQLIARAINRSTGVSFSRGGSLETDALFASRYTRAAIESIAYAAAKGGIEGHIARRRIGKLLVSVTTLSTAVALAQGRDLEEVLNPFDIRDGVIRLDPNFLSIRLAGHDMKPLGAYDGLGRLAVVAADAAQRTIRERDAMQLADFIGYTAVTKGSPLVSFITDLVKGETFEFEEPLSPESLAKRPLPFTAQNVISELQEGLPLEEVIVGNLFEALGAKTAPLTLGERTEEARDAAFRSAPVEDPVSGELIEIAGFDEAVERFGRARAIAIASGRSEQVRSLEERKGKRSEDILKGADQDASVAFAELYAIGEDRGRWSQSVQERIDAETLILADAREERKDFLARLNGRYQQVRQRYPDVLDGGEPDGPVGTVDEALSVYFALLREAEDEHGQFDSDLFYDEIEPRFIARIGVAMWERVQDNIGIKNRGPWEHELAETAADLDEAGFFGIRDQTWEWVAMQRGLEGFPTEREFRSAMKQQLRAQLSESGTSGGAAEAIVVRIYDGLESVKHWRDAANNVEQIWIVANPALADRAIVAGYLSPAVRAEELDALLAGSR